MMRGRNENCQTPDFPSQSNKRNLDGSIFGWLFVWLFGRSFVHRDFQNPPDLPDQQNFPRLRPFSELFQDFPRTFQGLSQDFLRSFTELSQNFLRTFSELSQDFRRTFSERSQDSLRNYFPRTFPRLFPAYCVELSLVLPFRIFCWCWQPFLADLYDAVRFLSDFISVLPNSIKIGEMQNNH